MKYLVVIEKVKENYSAYSPDIPGCVATGRTPRETRERMEDAITMHLKGLREDGLPLPEPAAMAEYVSVAPLLLI